MSPGMFSDIIHKFQNTVEFDWTQNLLCNKIIFSWEQMCYVHEIQLLQEQNIWINNL